MIRLTMHLKGVKKITVEGKKANPEGGFDYTKKSKCINTVTNLFKDESAGMNYMTQYLQSNQGRKITKYYFSNIL